MTDYGQSDEIKVLGSYLLSTETHDMEVPQLDPDTILRITPTRFTLSIAD